MEPSISEQLSSSMQMHSTQALFALAISLLFLLLTLWYSLRLYNKDYKCSQPSLTSSLNSSPKLILKTLIPI